jgi:hypothetical protein
MALADRYHDRAAANVLSAAARNQSLPAWPANDDGALITYSTCAIAAFPQARGRVSN